MPYSDGMTKTHRLLNLWTGAVAYVSLLLAAALSIAGNVADTYRVRGREAVDSLDIVMAASWPLLVLLAVEMFVSRRWTGQGWPMQVLRWTGSIAIGAMAMRVSWVHLHALMEWRGQEGDVAVLGPLAIDAMAIMATALIVAGRSHGVSSAGDVLLDKLSGELDTPALDSRAPAPEVDTQLDIDLDNTLAKHGIAVDDGLDVDTVLSRYGIPTDEEMADAMDRILDTPAPPERPVPSAARRQRGVISAEQAAEIADYYATGLAHGLARMEAQALLAGWYGVTTRTIRRALESVGVSPVSAPPARSEVFETS